MGVNERDPREKSYIALYAAIKWYQEITPESALRIVEGQSHAKPGNKITPDVLAEIRKIIQSPNFHNVNSLVRHFRINKYELFEALQIDKNEKYANEEVIVVPKIEFDLKKLSDKANKCPGVNCDGCVLNSITYGDYTMCEILCDIEFDSEGKLVSGANRGLQKTANNCNPELLAGETKIRGFEVYKTILEAFDKYAGDHKDKKIRDIVSTAFMEYLEKRKAK